MTETHARDHLANERTFLAWVRTSISLMGFGVVIAKLRFLTLETGVPGPGAMPEGTRSTWLGLAFAGVGLVTLLFSALQYDRNRRGIETGEYRASQRGLYLFAGVIFLLGLVSIGYLLTLSPVR